MAEFIPEDKAKTVVFFFWEKWKRLFLEMIIASHFLIALLNILIIILILST